MTPRPARREAGPDDRPARVTDTDFRAFINGADASRPCAEAFAMSVTFSSEVGTVACRKSRRHRALAGVVRATAWRLTICSASWISIRLALWSRNSRNTRSRRNSSSACIVSEFGARRIRSCAPRAPGPGTDRGKRRARPPPASGGRHRDGPRRWLSAPLTGRRALPQGRSAKARVRAIAPSPADRFARRWFFRSSIGPAGSDGKHRHDLGPRYFLEAGEQINQRLGVLVGFLQIVRMDELVAEPGIFAAVERLRRSSRSIAGRAGSSWRPDDRRARCRART